MAQVFIDDDEGFMRWRDEHPSGFILNTHRKPSPAYLVLHRADCGHLKSPNPLKWTTTGYIKICSSGVNDLIQWAQKEVPGYRGLRACLSCDP